MVERSCLCAKASSNNPADHAEGRAKANRMPPCLEAPDGEFPKQRVRYPSAPAQRRHAYPSTDILTRQAARQRYRFQFFCESRGTLCLYSCVAQNIVLMCVQTILTHNAKAKSPDVNEGCGGGCVDYHSISWLLSLFS